MLNLEEAQARYEALRERDRVIASLQSKQRMLHLFEHLLDEDARVGVGTQLKQSLAAVRNDAKELAVALARAAYVELQIDDLGRIRRQLEQFTEFLERTPTERLDACHDLLTFIRDLRALDGPPRPPPQ